MGKIIPLYDTACLDARVAKAAQVMIDELEGDGLMVVEDGIPICRERRLLEKIRDLSRAAAIKKQQAS